MFNDDMDVLSDLLAGWKWLGSGVHEDREMDDLLDIEQKDAVRSMDTDECGTVVQGEWKCPDVTNKQTINSISDDGTMSFFGRGQKNDLVFSHTGDVLQDGENIFGLGLEDKMINGGRKSFTHSANLLKMCPGSMECYEQDNLFFEQDSQGMQVSKEVQGGMQVTQEYMKVNNITQEENIITIYDKVILREIAYWAMNFCLRGGPL